MDRRPKAGAMPARHPTVAVLGTGGLTTAAGFTVAWKALDKSCGYAAWRW